MDWTITYRGQNGAQEQMSLEAESREAVFKELAARGVSAVRVEQAEGKAKPSKASLEGGGKPSGVGILKGALAGIIVVIAAGGVWYCFSTTEATHDVQVSGDGTTKKFATIVEAAPPMPSEEIHQASTPVSLGISSTNKVVHCVTNRQGKVIVISDEEWANFERVQRDTTLRTRTEKRLRLLASVPPGMPVPPMPGSSREIDDDIVETLKNEIEILPGDSEREIEHKKFVMDFKEYIKGEMAQGKKPSEAYNDYIARMNSVADLTTTGAKMARELRAEGDEEGAQRFLETVNMKLDSLGAPPISLDHRPRGIISKENRKE